MDNVLTNVWQDQTDNAFRQRFSFIDKQSPGNDDAHEILTNVEMLKKMAEQNAKALPIYALKILGLYNFKRKEEAVQSFVDQDFLTILAKKDAAVTFRFGIELLRKAPEYKDDIVEACSNPAFLKALDQNALISESFDAHAFFSDLLTYASDEKYEDTFNAITQTHSSYVLEKPFVKTLAKISFDRVKDIGAEIDMPQVNVFLQRQKNLVPA